MKAPHAFLRCLMALIVCSCLSKQVSADVNIPLAGNTLLIKGRFYYWVSPAVEAYGYHIDTYVAPARGYIPAKYISVKRHSTWPSTIAQVDGALSGRFVWDSSGAKTYHDSYVTNAPQTGSWNISGLTYTSLTETVETEINYTTGLVSGTNVGKHYTGVQKIRTESWDDGVLEYWNLKTSTPSSLYCGEGSFPLFGGIYTYTTTESVSETGSDGANSNYELDHYASSDGGWMVVYNVLSPEWTFISGRDPYLSRYSDWSNFETFYPGPYTEYESIVPEGYLTTANPVFAPVLLLVNGNLVAWTGGTIDITGVVTDTYTDTGTTGLQLEISGSARAFTAGSAPATVKVKVSPATSYTSIGECSVPASPEAAPEFDFSLGGWAIEGIVADTDGDGLSDYEETYRHSLNHEDADSDNDGLSDYEELCILTYEPTSTDTDEDGMDDGWEVTMGLDPADPKDAFADRDGDRVPNLWEHDRGTSGNNPSSVPALDATVDATLPTNVTLKRYATLQEAYDSLPSTPGYRAIVKVLRGVHQGSVNGVGAPKKVAWLAELGADRATGVDGTKFSGDDSTYESGMVLSDETVIDGLIFEFPASNDPAVRVVPDAAYSSVTTEVRLVNCIVRGWNIYHDVSYGLDSLGGALLNDGGDVWLVHTTLLNSSARPLYGASLFGVIENRSGNLHVMNSIAWDTWELSTDAVEGSAPTTVQTSVIKGGIGGAINSNPGLLLAGYLTPASASPDFLPTTSTVCMNAGTPIGLLNDIHGQPRGTTVVDIGADEWVSIDGDSLPDWWEQFWFGSLAQNDAGNPDDDWPENLGEYAWEQRPTGDQDGDELLDYWEELHFGSVTAQNGSGNPDGDMATNLQEYLADTDPNVAQTDWDNDGFLDSDEWTWFGTYSQTPQTDFDGDSLINSIEIAIGSNMSDPDSNDDGVKDGIAYMMGLSVTGTDSDGDGLSNVDELAMGTFVFAKDSDGDGVDDDVDYFPLDPLQSTSPTPSTGVTIVLLNPPGTPL